MPDAHAFARWRRLSPVTVDILLAAAAAVVTSVAVAFRALEDEPMQPLGYVLLAAQFVPLVWRRRAPVVVGTVVGLAGAAYGAAELPDPPIMFAPLLAWYTVAAYRPRSHSVPFILVAATVGIVTMIFARDADASDVAVNLFAGTMAWVVGDSTRSDRQRVKVLADRREDAERQAVAEERVRIARDLHDVVAHHVSVIAVQAEAAQSVLATRPDRAEKAMASVADTARGALGELRRLLGGLRADSDLAPQPDLAALDDLAATVRQTGLAVSLRVDDEAAGVEGLVGVAAYRVVQEALTNVLKHARARHVDVTVNVHGNALVVTVSDDGRGDTRPARAARSGDGDRRDRVGFGLAGMRERARILGGDLSAGGRIEGAGFTVRARLPLEA